MIRLTATNVTVDAAIDTTPSRTITGLAVPWNVPATVSTGQTVRFLPGSLSETGKAPKLMAGHDMDELPLGIVTERVSTDVGMMFAAQIAPTSCGDDALALLLMGAIDSVSVGAEPVRWSVDAAGVMNIEQADWIELSLVNVPAFADATIDSVAASAPETEPTDPTTTTPVLKEDAMPEHITEEVEIIPTTPAPSITAARAPKLPTAAEYIAAAIAGGDRFSAVRTAVQAAAPDVTTSTTAGLLPISVVGPLYDGLVGRRPFVDAFQTRGMPTSGKVFIRPSITTHVSVAEQANELATLQAGEFVVTDNLVTKATYGGYVRVSMQDIEWTDPAVVSYILGDLAKVYGLQTDYAAVDQFTTWAESECGSRPAFDITDPAAWSGFIYDAAADILSAGGGALPTHLFIGTGVWAALGQLVDSTGRPLFPQAGPMNAFGNMAPGQYNATAFGLTVVVDANMANDRIYVADTAGFEIFEDPRGALALDDPSTLGRTLSWHGYFSTLGIDPSKVVYGSPAA